MPKAYRRKKIIMAMNVKQQDVVNASRGYIKAKNAAVKAFQALCGDDLTTDDAKRLVSEVLVLVRTINGVVASVKACSDAKSGPMAQAGRDYWAITKAFTRAKAETVEKVETVPVGFADSILRDAGKIISRIQNAKPEKITFPVAETIAAFQAAMGKVRK